MDDFTFLSTDEIFDNPIGIIEKRGTKAAISDFSILRGGYVSDSYKIDGGSTLGDRSGYYWTTTQYSDSFARVVNDYGNRIWSSTNKRRDGCRPALKFSSIDSILANAVSINTASDGIKEVEYGYYPQNAVEKMMQDILESGYNNGLLKQTGNKYTVDEVAYDDYSASFSGVDIEEYEYNGDRYVRVLVNSCYDGNKFTLSNGESYKDGDYVWVKVEPIKWLIDSDKNIMVSDKLLFSGIQFKNDGKYDGDFSKTDVKKFMDEHFSKDIEQIQTPIITNANSQQPSNASAARKTRLENLNPDKTDVSQRRDMTDSELIQDWIESGLSVLLRGPSGIGKTERIKTLYPDLIYIKLTNNMFPEKVVGSMNLQTGQSIPPDFAKQALLECANDEERELIKQNIQNIYDLADTIYERSKNTEKKTVILLDELLNVKPAVQSLVYTLVLNRLVETGKGLKLPFNTVVVATGNQKKYSSVAEDLAEPLEKRFDHILDMMPKVGEWISEYAIPNKVHPSVIGYILSKYNQKGRSEKIEDMGYFYEEPQVGASNLDSNGCRGRTNDPRGWVSISNTLYKFEKNLSEGKYVGKNVENILNASINTKLRNIWAIDFIHFYNIPTLSVEDVVNGNYTQADLPRDINERFACVSSLLLANEDEVEKVREFIKENCDAEYLQLYDGCWVGKDDARMQKLLEIEELSQISIEGKGKTK